MIPLWLFLACETPSEVVAEDESQGPTLVGVTWALAWRLGAVTVDGDGLTLPSEDGDTLTVTQGSLGDIGLSLIPCEEADSGLAGLGLIRAAYAGHGATLDSSTWSAGQVEQLTAPEPIVLGTALFEPTRYCGVHYAVAPAGQAWAGASDEATGKTLRLVGGFGDAAPSALAETNYAHGAILDLRPAAEALDPLQAHDLTVTITRDLEALLGAVTPNTDPHDNAWAALGQMMDTISLSLTPTDE
jgi:hypothetical protein